MNTLLIIAISFIFAACLVYTVGVWSERISRRLKAWHVVVFWLGLTCDTIGTGAMMKMAGSLIQLNFHGLTGLTAILLMLFHAVWATRVIIRNDKTMILRFHKFSIIVWAIWLIPMISGMILGSNV